MKIQNPKNIEIHNFESIPWLTANPGSRSLLTKDVAGNYRNTKPKHIEIQKCPIIEIQTQKILKFTIVSRSPG